MPAGLTNTDEMAYVGQMPWHGLGVKVEGDAMTAAQAIEATGMDWTVSIRPLYLSNGAKVDSAVATYRNDTHEVLGVVGNRYQPVQNIEGFNLFDAVTGTGEAKYHTVGTLNGGRRIWLLAKFADGILLDNGEQIDSYMLLMNSHDGSSALTMRWTDIRVVCQNTFEAAKRDRSDTQKGLQRFYARHIRNILLKANEAREILQLQTEYRKTLEEEINTLVDKAWDAHDMERLTYTLLELDTTRPIDAQNGTTKVNAETITGLFRSGIGNSGKSAWDAFNAVTEFTSHYKGHGRSVDTIGATDEKVVNNRLNNNWFGDGVTMRDRAWDILTANEENKESKLVTLAY